MEIELSIYIGGVFRVDLQWETSPDEADPLDYLYTVERSGSPEGPFEPLVEDLDGVFVFSDREVILSSGIRRYFYRIKAKHKTKDEVVYSPVRSPGELAKPPLDALEIRRLETLLFEGFIGRRAWLLPVRTFGPRCPVCYNEVMGRKTTHTCTSCYGTTYAGGYFRPIEIWIHIAPTPLEIVNTSQFESDRVVTQARMDAFPPIKPRDVIIEADNTRWRVRRVLTTQRVRYPIHQEITLVKIAPMDIEYKIPINPEEVFKLSPVKEKFQRPRTTVR